MKGILLDDNLDVLITNKSLLVGDSTSQNQKILILSDKGEIKSNPMRGVGVRRFLEAETPDDLAREIRVEFIADGMNVNKIRIDLENKIEVDANYGS